MNMIKIVFFVSCLLGITAAIAEPQPMDISAPEIVGGRYYLAIDGVRIVDKEGFKNYYLQDYTAFGAAARLADTCWCKVDIETPDISVKPKRVARENTLGKGLHIEWETPVLRDNKKELLITEIHKFVISYWQEGSPTLSVEVLEASATEHFIWNVGPGKWFVQVATVDTDLVQSNWTVIVSQLI